MSNNRKNDSSKKAVLSFGKLSSLLSSKDYTLATVYCNKEGDVHFIEARTPKIQKTFIISIPEKYKMAVTSDTEHYKIVNITKLRGGVEGTQIDYITEVKGPLLDCDLLSVSSKMLCLCKNNTDIEVYKFGKEEDTPEPEEFENLENLEQDPVELIIKSAKKINKKMGGYDLEIPEEEPEKVAEEEEPAEEEQVEEPEVNDAEEKEPEEEEKEASEVTPVELEFRDANDNLLEEKEVSEENLPVENATENEELKKEVEEVTRQPKDSRRKDNSIPENIEDVDISLGIIYYSVEIGLFNKKVLNKGDPVVTSFEDEVIAAYDTIDDNECDIRNAKLDEVIEMAAKLALKAKDEVEKSKKEELNLKTQILKLSAVLNHLEGSRTKMNIKPEKYTEIRPEVERLYKQTKTTLYEVNVEILRNKDRIDEILALCQTSLEELLDA